MPRNCPVISVCSLSSPCTQLTSPWHLLTFLKKEKKIPARLNILERSRKFPESSKRKMRKGSCFLLHTHQHLFQTSAPQGIFIYVYLFLRGRERIHSQRQRIHSACTSGGGAETEGRQRVRNQLCADSREPNTEPYLGLKVKNRESGARTQEQ